MDKKITLCAGLTAILLVTAGPAAGQRYLSEAHPYSNRLILRVGDTLIRVTLARRISPEKAGDPARWYSWYSKDSVRHTQGAYSGHLLHGHYAEWYPNRQLKVTGSYHRGLKNGRWQYHDANGTLRKATHWLYGRETGRFALYSPQGKRVQKGWLWDGEVVGKGKGEPDSARAEKKGWMRRLF